MAYRESYAGKINRKLNKKLHVVEVASGRQKADLVLKNATYVNVFCNELSHGDIAVAGGLIAGMGEHYEGAVEVDMGGKLVLPGFVDAHIHLESALVSPKEFANAVIPHGTTTVITDPHEIANVMGTDGIEYMLQATEDLPVDVRFMLPSCVPATPLDESGAVLDYRAIDSFYEHNRVEGLAEMMNYVGVANADEQVLEKIVAAQAHHKKIDGHAPGLSGNDLNAYIAAGVYSDHECSTVEDAIAKLGRGQYIMIREGTAARNLDALLPLLTLQYYTYCMFCTDDKHPNDLLEKGHIDYIVRRAIKSGVDPIIAVKCASHHAARYFLLNNRGAIAPGFLADFVIIDNFDDFNILEVYKKGKLMFDGKTVTPFEAPEIDPHLVKRSHETFHVAHLEATDFIESRPRAVLGMVPGEIVTTDAGYAEKISVEDDILKIAVIERHKNTHHIGIGYIKGYGLKSGAVATSISHDSHNIIVVGANEEDMAAAINRVVELGGGIVVMDDGKVLGELQLQIAGIMSEAPLIEVNEALENAKEQAFKLGVSRGVDPFMTLSFMALTVIPTLRLTTRGVFDVINQRYV
ncbi:MAG: adenine deaminase [Oscillospiraceae bacterium]|nr:adenine deaminase [Oscillospiraceae bacterium]